MSDSELQIWRHRLELATNARRYWHRAFIISMFFHGMISFPIVVALIKTAIMSKFQ